MLKRENKKLFPPTFFTQAKPSMCVVSFTTSAFYDFISIVWLSGEYILCLVNETTIRKLLKQLSDIRTTLQFNRDNYCITHSPVACHIKTNLMVDVNAVIFIRILTVAVIQNSLSSLIVLGLARWQTTLCLLILT